MVIDYSGGLLPTQSTDVKILKKGGALESRPVEESGSSDDTKFDTGRQHISKREFPAQVFSSRHNDVVLYNKKGDLERDTTGGEQDSSKEVRIDLIV